MAAKRGRERLWAYNIRYRMDFTNGGEYHDARGSGTHPRLPGYALEFPIRMYEVEGYYGTDQFNSDDFVEVMTPDRAVADGVFRLLAQRFDSVSLRVHPLRDADRRPVGEREDGMRIENLDPEYLAPVILDACVCQEPQPSLVLSPEILETRERALEAARRARLPKAPRVPRNRPNTGQVMPRLRARILERDDFRCQRCGADSSKTALEVDHIVPRAKGGTNDERNLQTLCWACNRGKRDADPHPEELTRFA